LSFAKNITPLLKIKKIDFALIFAISKHQLKDILKDVLPALNEDAKLWIAYPKLTSKIVSDLSRDCNWECIAQSGYEGVRMISLDHVWCAMRFKKADKVQHVFEDVVPMSYVDMETRVITTPPELEKLFVEHTAARTFFDSLSFTNKKEYVVWITGSKKEETKIARLNSAIEKLNSGRKNPSEK
jgi:hypothetical protein